MRKILPLCATALICLAAAPAVAQEKTDEELVRACVLDYFEGWFGGDAARFRRALHPDLCKRIPRRDEAGEPILRPSDIDEMAAYIESGRSKRPFEEANIEVTIYEISHDVAIAKGSCTWFFDYLHLAKIDGEWKIVNVLWQTYPRE